MKRFKQLVKDLVNTDHLPDYSIKMEDNVVTFYNRNHKKMEQWFDKSHDSKSDFPQLKEDTYKTARSIAPLYDVYFLEQAWLSFWCDSGRPKLDNPDGAFIAFCKRRQEVRPNP